MNELEAEGAEEFPPGIPAVNVDEVGLDEAGEMLNSPEKPLDVGLNPPSATPHDRYDLRARGDGYLRDREHLNLRISRDPDLIYLIRDQAEDI